MTSDRVQTTLVKEGELQSPAQPDVPEFGPETDADAPITIDTADQATLRKDGSVVHPIELDDDGMPYTIAYIKDYLAGIFGGEDIFDVRDWERADREEVTERLRQGWGDRAGHGNLLVQVLLRRWPVERIADLLMSARDAAVGWWRDVWWQDAVRDWSRGDDRHIKEGYENYVKCCRFLGEEPRPIAALPDDIVPPCPFCKKKLETKVALDRHLKRCIKALERDIEQRRAALRDENAQGSPPDSAKSALESA